MMLLILRHDDRIMFFFSKSDMFLYKVGYIFHIGHVVLNLFVTLMQLGYLPLQFDRNECGAWQCLEVSHVML